MTYCVGVLLNEGIVFASDSEQSGRSAQNASVGARGPAERCTLEQRLVEAGDRYERVWYLCDGVHSMLCAPACPARALDVTGCARLFPPATEGRRLASSAVLSFGPRARGGLHPGGLARIARLLGARAGHLLAERALLRNSTLGRH